MLLHSAGGRNLWGPNAEHPKEGQRPHKPPSFSDGVLEVSGCAPDAFCFISPI